MGDVIQNRVLNGLLAQEIERERGSRVEITLEQAQFLGLQLDQGDNVVRLPRSVEELESLKTTADRENAIVPPWGYVCVLGPTVILYWPFEADCRVVRFVSQEAAA